MQKRLLFLFCISLFTQLAIAQVYVDEFDNNDASFFDGPGTHSFSASNGELTITADNINMWEAFSYQTHDASNGMPLIVDATGNNKIYVRAKASNLGVQLRMDIEDEDGFVTSQAGITKTLTTDFMVLEFDFTGNYTDGGYGGTACATGPCPVDGSKTRQLVFFINPGQMGFSGSVVIDYISFGEESQGVIMSDIFQDHFDQDSSVNSFVDIAAGYNVALSGDSEVNITGDGSNDMWGAIGYNIRNPNSLESIDIDVSPGNNKLFVKVKSTADNTALRFDLQDVDGFTTTQGSITKIVGTEYSILEFDFTGAFSDLGFGGTPCTMNTAPCPVDPTRISTMVIFVNPGTPEFLGTVTIDYISFGTSLEPPGDEPELLYQDHFNNDTIEWTGEAPGLTLEEMGTELTITGDSTAGPYSAVSYILHDSMGNQIHLDMEPGKNKVFIRVKVEDENNMVPLRIDLIDTADYHTSQTSLTKVVSGEFLTYEYDFSGAYFDGGFGGTACEEGMGPCPVNSQAITQLLIYPDPDLGFFNGKLIIDFISIGQPAGDAPTGGPTGVINYMDEIGDNTSLFITDAPGLVTTTANSEWLISGDGSSGMWNSMVYKPHNELGEEIMVDAVGSGDKLYVRAKSSVANTDLRIDLQDIENYVTNQSGITNSLSTEYEILEFNYANGYNDGGFGGSPCTSDTAPCPVDGERIAQLQFFINPGVGLFDGEVSIDWISFGEPIGVAVQDLTRLNSLRAFPNPTSGQLMLEYNLAQAGQVQVRIFDTMGREMMINNIGQQGAGTGTQLTDMSNLPAGLYLVQFTIDGYNAGMLRVLKNN